MERKMINSTPRTWTVLLCLLLTTLQACAQQSQHIDNSPCATANASIDIKPSSQLSLAFGNDAIKAAVDAITKNPGLKATMPNELARLGTDKAVHVAESNDKTPTPEDKSSLETYLKEEVIPTIRQNPTCVFNIVSAAPPFFSVERISMNNLGENPRVIVKNWGQVHANYRILVRQILDGKEHSRGDTDLTLGSGQTRSLNIPTPILPIPEIIAGKNTLMILLDMSYLPPSGRKWITNNEAYQYDHSSKLFSLAHKKFDSASQTYYWAPPN